MKRYFISLFLLFGLFACQNEKKYKLAITLKQKSILSGGMEETKKEETIKAVNDSLAYQEAVISFDSWKQTYKMTESSEFASIPISFVLKDEKGVDVSTKLSSITKQTIEDFVHKLTNETVSRINNSSKDDSVNKQQEKIAFGNLRFGMSKKEYDHLPKKDQDYFQKIGNYEYMMEPFFDDSNRLYMLQFTTVSKDANYIDTYVKSSAQNFNDVISAKYGSGELLNTFPSILEFQSGYIRWMYQWQIGNKIIKIGAGEVSSGSEFYSICWIYDNKLYDQQKLKDQNASKSQQKQDGEKF